MEVDNDGGTTTRSGAELFALDWLRANREKLAKHVRRSFHARINYRRRRFCRRGVFCSRDDAEVEHLNDGTRFVRKGQAVPVVVIFLRRRLRFRTIRDTIPDNLVNLFDYVEHNYVRGQRHGRGRQVPILPSSAWNCYFRTLENLPRTTNSCEACHRRLNTVIGKFPPSFYHVLESLQDETAKIHNDRPIEKLEGGQSPPRKKKTYTDLDTRLSRIVERYHEYRVNENVPGYLRVNGHGVAGHFG
ncbi:hypothetical protein ANN_24445 [Periplaneta americana]|uniref:Uncharacterized protein n=1 Tax=Periplaneta americana TaxID=6978 RepID=A0ABQ8S341_PERAM|nr:hypothetical protein ANN_24445 [Periplaneta americana]